MNKTQLAAIARQRQRIYDRRSAIKRGRHYIDTLKGKAASDLAVIALVDFLDGQYAVKTEPMPGDLADVLAQLTHKELAQVAINQLMHLIAARWNGHDEDSAYMLLCMQLGQHLRHVLAFKSALNSGVPLKALQPKRRRRKAGEPKRRRGRKSNNSKFEFKHDSWTPDAEVAAGAWLLDCVMTLDYFDVDNRGLPVVASKLQSEINSARLDFIWENALPHLSPPPAWEGWFASYPDRPRAPFVRDWRLDTRIAIERAFTEREIETVPDESSPDITATLTREIPGRFVREHVEGISRLKQVAFTVNQDIVDLVEQFAVDIIGHKNKKRINDIWLVQHDVDVARLIGDREFRQDYCCDWRGRVYSTTHFAFEREDHVRAMFRFAKPKCMGNRLANAVGGYTDLEFLEIHCANMWGEDKLPWAGRLAWVNKNRGTHKKPGLIRRVAEKPFNTFTEWRTADKPFCFVAACRELVKAWDTPNFETHLPLQFDGSANGLQHLAMLSRDREVAKFVNLLPNEPPHDVYMEILAAVVVRLETSNDPKAAFWKKKLRTLKDGDKRKFVKAGVMTYPYGVTDKGMTLQVGRAYFDRFGKKAPKGRCGYFAGLIQDAVNHRLPGAATVREYIRDLAAGAAGFWQFLQWTSPTGFPCNNRYLPPRTVRVKLPGGSKVEVSVGVKPPDDEYLKKAIRSAAPNFIHALDAAHLIKTILGLTDDGIESIAVVHDCFCVLAPDAAAFKRIVNRELFLMYVHQDWLGRLRAENGITELPPPPFGTLDLEQVLHNEYGWM